MKLIDKCVYCAAEISFNPDESIVECKCCGSMNANPSHTDSDWVQTKRPVKQKCVCCMQDITFEAGELVVRCEYCGRLNARSTAQEKD